MASTRRVPDDGPGALRPSPPPRAVAVTIIAQDPSVKDRAKRILTSEVAIPAERLEPGPRSHRFFVVDYDTTTKTARCPVRLTDPDGQFVDRFKDPAHKGISDDDLERDPAFWAQNVYAIAARILAVFERYLGRRLPWSYPSHELFLVPNAMAEANAYYTSELHAVLFGYITRPTGEVVRSCLSHDIVAHEVTHAILDGLRPRYVEPGLPDQLGFHEAFADLVALLSVFSLPEVLDQQLKKADRSGRIAAGAVSAEAIEQSVFLGVAEQFGRAIGRGSALRRSVTLPRDGGSWRGDLAFGEPHRRGEVLVAAVMRTLCVMWANRVADITHNGRVDRERAVEEGQMAAEHLLGMLIRAIDYTPPIELEFEDFLEAVLVADETLAPDDAHDYRGSLKASFAEYGISPASRIVDYTTRDTPWPDYRNINFDSLRRDTAEVYRFIWNNARLLGIDDTFHLEVYRVRHATRTGPDGLVISEVIADYTQNLSTTAGRLKNIKPAESQGDRSSPAIVIPEELDPDTPVQLWGGGTLIFDQFAKLRFHQRKGLAWGDSDIWRQQRRLDHLYGSNIRDRRNRIGFSDGRPLGQRFAALHFDDRDAMESWQ
ncbi:hypothetical protein [Mycobacterium sp. shizuoka-1]|uniref:hypothetical protein n=1 Tax=Mycobacterium sp. shizuoka-1 TaxID=2039281 RepID=UPI000C060F4D|nr:hypothetical protein [Mycobacterium sp. shizuoka-1]GAY16836.1 hypothetical protein MSZK_35620 [Mycobacterium sp. shizuoka-1]